MRASGDQGGSRWRDCDCRESKQQGFIQRASERASGRDIENKNETEEQQEEQQRRNEPRRHRPDRSRNSRGLLFDLFVPFRLCRLYTFRFS